MKLLKWQKFILVIYPLYQAGKTAISVISHKDFLLSGMFFAVFFLALTTGIIAFLFWIWNKIYYKVANKNIENAKDLDIIKAFKILLTVIIVGSVSLIFLSIINNSFKEITILLSALVTVVVFFMIVTGVIIIARIFGKSLKNMLKWAIITLTSTFSFWFVVFLYDFFSNQ